MQFVCGGGTEGSCAALASILSGDPVHRSAAVTCRAKLAYPVNELRNDRTVVVIKYLPPNSAHYNVPAPPECLRDLRSLSTEIHKLAAHKKPIGTCVLSD